MQGSCDSLCRGHRGGQEPQDPVAHRQAAVADQFRQPQDALSNPLLALRGPLADRWPAQLAHLQQGRELSHPLRRGAAVGAAAALAAGALCLVGKPRPDRLRAHAVALTLSDAAPRLASRRQAALSKGAPPSPTYCPSPRPDPFARAACGLSPLSRTIRPPLRRALAGAAAPLPPFQRLRAVCVPAV